MSRGSTLRRSSQRAHGIPHGSIRQRQNPSTTKQSMLWDIERAKREVERRQYRLDLAMKVLVQYWNLFMKAFPEEAKAMLEMEQQMIQEQEQARKEVRVPGTNQVSKGSGVGIHEDTHSPDGGMPSTGAKE